MKKRLFILMFSIILLSNFVLAANCPPVGPPKIYSGNIYVNENLLSGTYNLHAMIGDDRVGEVEFSDGVYSNLQISPCSGVSGEIIFSVNGIEANERGYYYGTQDEWGEKVVLDLTLNEMPPVESPCGNGELDPGEECDGALLAQCGNGYEGTISCNRDTCLIDYSNCIMLFCGDGTCNNGETCSTCPNDCGACASPTTPSTSSGGGGSGGGGSSGGSSSTKKLSTNETTTNSGDQIDIQLQAGGEKEEESVESKGLFSITGHSVSEFIQSKTGRGILIASLVVLVGLLIFVKQRRKNSKEDKN